MEKELREKYMKIGHVTCPALSNEKVYFSRKGFDHLTHKGRIPRSEADKRRRLNLFEYVIKIVSAAKTWTEYRQENNIEFWSIELKKNRRRIIVVISQIKGESKKFFSVMDKKHKSPG